MEAMLVLGGLGLLIALPIGALMGMIAWSRVNRLRTQVEDLEHQVRLLRQQTARAVPSAPPAEVALRAKPVAQQEPPAPPELVAPPEPQPAPMAPTPSLPVLVEPLVVEPREALTAASLPETPTPKLVAAVAPVVESQVVEVPVPEVGVPPVAAGPVVAAPIPTSAPQPELRGTIASPAAARSADGLEATFGKRWLTWAGVALVFLSGVFLLKYAYDQDWLGHLITPPIRLALITATAAVMVGLGLRVLRAGMAALGHGLTGGGIAVAYLAVYAGFSPAVMLAPEPLFPGQVAFVLMALVTAVGMTLAVRFSAIAMAFCAILGGFATPVLIDTGGGSREALFAYILLLDLGVLAAALFRAWRALDLLAFVGTVGIYTGWQLTRGQGADGPWATLAWLLVFHAVFLILPFVRHWRLRTVVTVERVALAVGNLAFTLAAAAVLLRGAHQLALAGICLILAGAYLGIGLWTRQRIPADTKIGHGFLALGVMLITLGLFYLLPVEAVATAWIVEAVTLLVLGYRYAHAPTRIIAHVVLGVALLRLAVTELPFTYVRVPFLFNTWVLALVVGPLGVAAVAEVHRRCGMPAARQIQILCWWLAGGLTLALGSGEIEHFAAGHVDLAGRWVTPASAHGLWWTVGGVAYLAAAWRWSCVATARIALIPVLGGIACALAAYAQTWMGGIPVANPRFLVTVAALAGLGWWLHRTSPGRSRLAAVAEVRPSLLAATQLAGVVLLTLETFSWYHRPLAEAVAGSSGDLHQTLVIVWAVAAFAGLLAGQISRQLLCAQVAVIPLVAALVAGFALYLRDAVSVVPLANGRFLALGLAVAVLAAQRWVFVAPGLPSLTQLVATAALTCELGWWMGTAYPSGDGAFSHMVWAMAACWAASAALATWRWRAGAPRDARHVAIALGLLAVTPALATYAFAWDTWLPFLNLRFVAPAAVVGALAWTWWEGRRRRDPAQPGTSNILVEIAAVVGFIAVSCEAPLHFRTAIADPALAARVATFSLTVTWVVAATIALAIGFRWRVPVVRYLALGLFVLTAGKLLLVDMSGFQQLYRILSFMLTGVVFIGAAYAYHRLERWLGGPESGGEPPKSPSP